MQKIISFDLRAEFGMLKKPFSNEKLDLYLTFNMLHKPALLGILGAIIGLDGYKQYGVVPEYYNKLEKLKIGIEPLENYHANGIFQKTTIKFNNSVGYASKEEGGNLIIHEQILIKPAFRCYLLIDSSLSNYVDIEIQEKLYNSLKNCEAEYLPYLGKNDFSAWWEKGINENSYIKEYTNYKEFDFSTDFVIKTIFIKNEVVGKFIALSFGRAARKETKNQFTYFERLPIGFRDTEPFQYTIEDFAYTQSKLEKECKIDNLYQIGNNETVQLF